MGYYILFDYVHVFYVLLFTRYSCNIANVCVKHQSINQSMIYYYLLLTKRKHMHSISVRQCIHLRIECILLKFHWGMKALTETQVWKRWPKYIFNWNVLRSTLSYPNETSKECIENVLRSTLSYPYETSKECIQNWKCTSVNAFIPQCNFKRMHSILIIIFKSHQNLIFRCEFYLC